MSDFAALQRHAQPSAQGGGAAQMKSDLARRLNGSPQAVAQAKLAQSLVAQREEVPHDDETFAVQQMADPALGVGEEEVERL